MSVERSHTDYQTRYEVRDEEKLSSVLTYTAEENEPAVWKILRPAPDGMEDVYSSRQFSSPDAKQLLAWLKPVVGADDAAELTDAVDAAPPGPAAWRSSSGA
jgi:hypothetical protein